LQEEGVTNVTTETGAGQWGAALSYAAKVFGLEAAVYQVKISYNQKALSPQHHADIRSNGHRLSIHVYPCWQGYHYP